MPQPPMFFFMRSDDGTSSERKPTAESRARSGALIRIAHDGSVEIERGLIDPADAKAEAKRLQAEVGNGPTQARAIQLRWWNI